MARFYFFIKARDRLISDDEGADLSGPDEARQEAIKIARETVAECVRTGRDLDVEAIIVTDGEGHPVVTLPFERVLPRRLRRN
jgi:hypothetical protein